MSHVVCQACKTAGELTPDGSLPLFCHHCGEGTFQSQCAPFTVESSPDPDSLGMVESSPDPDSLGTVEVAITKSDPPESSAAAEIPCTVVEVSFPLDVDPPDTPAPPRFPDAEAPTQVDTPKSKRQLKREAQMAAAKVLGTPPPADETEE